MTTIIRNIILLTSLFLTFHCYSQDSLVDDFKLKSNNKTKLISSSDEITIVSKWRWSKDSTQIDIEAQWDTAFCVTKDTLVIRPSRVYHQKFLSNANPIRDIKDYKPNSDYKIKLPINEIDKIKVKRQFIQWPTAIIGYLALTSAVLVAPIISIDKKFNVDRYKKVASYSLITATTMLTINLAFGTKTYHIKKHKNKRIWTLN